MVDRVGAVRLLGCCLGALLGIVPDADAQSANVRGWVRSTDGQPVVAADVSILALRAVTRTNDSGRFEFAKVPLGAVEVSIRRLGYQPHITHLVVQGTNSDSVVVTLEVQPEVLEAISVSASDKRQRLWIEDFYRRRSHGLGTFITRDEIERRNSFAPSDMFRTVPGVRLIKVASGRGVRFNNTSISRRDCAPMLWIDGQRAPGMEIDDLPLTDIEGIEIYPGPSTTPWQFSQSSSAQTFGTIVIWSRPPMAAVRKR